MRMRRNFLRSGFAAAASLGVFGAQAKSTRPITIIVGFSPGGSPDLVARTLADKLAIKLERPVVVENRSGAAGQLALAVLTTGKADGSAYVLTPSAMVTSVPLLYSKLPFDPKMLEPVLTACRYEYGVVAGAATPARTLAELLAANKAEPSRASYGIPGPGTSPHYIGMLLARAAEVDAQAVLYRGGPPMLSDLLGGQIPYAINVLSNFVDYHRAGRIRVLAVSGSKRSPLLPDVPTLAETGHPQAEVDDWYAFMAKVGTPRAESAAFSAAVRDVLDMPAVQKTLLESAHYPFVIPAQELAADIASSQKKWAELIKTSGFKIES